MLVWYQVTTLEPEDWSETTRNTVKSLVTETCRLKLAGPSHLCVRTRRSLSTAFSWGCVCKLVSHSEMGKLSLVGERKRTQDLFNLIMHGI